MAFIPQIFTVPTFVTGASLSPGLQMPGNYLYMYLVVPTMSVGYSAGTPIYVQGSADGQNFYRFSEILTSTVTNDFQIASAVSQRIVYIPNFSNQYIKLEVSGSVTGPAALNFKIICVSNQ